MRRGREEIRSKIYPAKECLQLPNFLGKALSLYAYSAMNSLMDQCVSDGSIFMLQPPLNMDNTWKPGLLETNHISIITHYV